MEEVGERVFIPQTTGKTPMLKDVYHEARVVDSSDEDQEEKEEEERKRKSFNLEKYLSVDVDTDSDSQQV